MLKSELEFSFKSWNFLEVENFDPCNVYLFFGLRMENISCKQINDQLQV